MSESFKTFRDPLLSLYQSAVAEVAEEIEKGPKAGPGRRSMLRRSKTSSLSDTAAQIAEREFKRLTGDVSASPLPRPSPRELSKTGIAQVCAEWGLRYLRSLALGDEKTIEQLKTEFTAGTCDPAWLTTLEAYRSYFGNNGQRKPVPYVRAASAGPKTIEIKANARVALMGDWGTGASPAIDVLKTIANDDPDLVVHLGDIYYSGTPAECRSNFVDPIDAILRSQKQVPVYSLSGNHDMYCGGVGFYNLIPVLNSAPFTQPASFFCLRSADEKWQLLAMDTGLHDDNPATVSDALTYLEEDELAWHCDRIKEFTGRTILLSHHQLFSAFSPIGPTSADGRRSAVNSRLLQAFKRMTDVKSVAAWFWGHEHTLSVYKPFAGLERGRCLGHGAVPVSVIDEIYKPLSNLESSPSLVDQSKLGTTGGVYNHGYALLAFEGDACRAEYYQKTKSGRAVMYTEMFS
jgi:3',5'-cyclic AMP phosphodiesterase CpdA